ncbi:tryptophan-rich sensory protein [Paracoccaceae bacterium Fryx2]|nr:tryptophan-rich sensory protein [Paracoccaceae bacterium Fryx2]
MTRHLALLTLLATIAFALSPLTTSGFNGFTSGQFPVPQVDPAVQPAGYAFSIWGVIYLWLILGAGYGLWKRADDADWQRMRPPLIASLAVGAFWIPVANVSPIAATVMIWAMLLGALIALMRAGRGDHGWQRAPVALYAGWLTAASCVSLGLVVAGHGLMSSQTAALLALALALAVALAVSLLRRDTPAYGVAVIWALVGVIVSNLQPVNGTVIALCVLGIAILSWFTLRSLRRTV